MIQLTVFITLYLSTMTILLFADTKGTKYYLIYTIDSFYKKNKYFQIIMKLSPLVLFPLAVLYPVYPGPIVLGDLFVSILLLLSPILLIAHTVVEKKKIKTYDFIKKIEVIAYIFAIITIIHVILPQIILL